MEIARGKKTVDLPEKDFKKIKKRYPRVAADLGCGDGKFAYEMARRNPDTLYVGIDADRNNLVKYASRIVRKRSKGGLDNVIYLISNVEDLPDVLEGIFSEIWIILPWGSLLEGIVNGRELYLRNIRRIGSPGSKIRIYLNYDLKYEPVEMEKRGLPPLTEDYIKSSLIPGFESNGFAETEWEFLANEEVSPIPSTWTRKLAFGRERRTLKLAARIEGDMR